MYGRMRVYVYPQIRVDLSVLWRALGICREFSFALDGGAKERKGKSDEIDLNNFCVPQLADDDVKRTAGSSTLLGCTYTSQKESAVYTAIRNSEEKAESRS